MLVAKQVADIITSSRLLLTPGFAWLGISLGKEGLPIAAGMMLYSWLSDSIDGPIARRSRRYYHTWLGDHDLEVDMAVSIGLWFYMILSGYIGLLIGALYLILWILLFIYLGFHRSLGMLLQAPIYAWFLYLTLVETTIFGILILAYLIAILMITWPRFPQEIVPGFLAGFRSIKKEGR